MKIFLVALGLAALCSCGSSSRKKEKSLAEMKMGERFSYGLKAMKEGHSSKDRRFRSQYDKSAASVLSQGKSGSAGWLGRQKSGGVQNFNGVKSFKADDFKTQTFSGADDKNWMGKKALTERDKVPSFADTSFGTKESSFANDSAREGKKVSRDADDVFKTSMNYVGTKSQKENRGPRIIVLPEQSQDPAYSEDQVKRLLGRD